MTAAVEVRRTNTILYRDYWADTVTFYRDTLGLAVTYANDWFVAVHVAETAHLSLADAARATIPASGGAGITLSWQVPDPEGTRIELWSPAR